MHYGMAVDLKKCMGCQTCSTSCKLANNLPQGIWWNRVLTDGGNYVDTVGSVLSNRVISHLPVACQHCENPACVKVCPVGATYKDPETGAVRQDYDKCIGCRMCMGACPYTGVRSFNWDEPVNSVGHAVGDADAAPHQKHTVEKCTFCYQRTSQGNKPKCVTACPGRARVWGDLDDSDSEISKLIASRECKQLLPEEGTKPSVYYLV